MKHTTLRHTMLFILCAVFTAFAGCKSSREVTQEDIANHDAALQAVNLRDFMVKADRLAIKHHTLPSVNASTNFILVDGNRATVQVSPAFGGGPNGVGGFTVNGTITGYDLKVKDNGEINLRYHIQAIAGSCDVAVKVMKQSNVAVAHITGTFKGGSATIYGQLEPSDNSIFIGRAR